MDKKKTVLTLFLISVFLLGFLPVKDTDFGWHYRCGKEFWEQGRLCTQNRFSYFLPDYKSYNPHFLYDFTLSAVYDPFGFLGVNAMGGLIFTLIGYFFIKLTSPAPLILRVVGFYTAFFLSGSTLSLGLRSQILTILFYLITLFLILQVNRYFSKSQAYTSLFEKSTLVQTVKYAALFFLLNLLWVNTHIGFFVGIIILTFWLTDSLMKLMKSLTFHVPKTSGYSSKFESIRVFSKFELIRVLILFISILATLLNPFGWRVYLEIVNHAFAPMAQTIAEWVPPVFWQKILVVSLSIIITVSILAKKTRFSF